MSENWAPNPLTFQMILKLTGSVIVKEGMQANFFKLLHDVCDTIPDTVRCNDYKQQCYIPVLGNGFLSELRSMDKTSAACKHGKMVESMNMRKGMVLYIPLGVPVFANVLLSLSPVLPPPLVDNFRK